MSAPSIKEFPILYVDDEPMNIRVFEANFSAEFSIVSVASGAQALRVLEERDPIPHGRHFAASRGQVLDPARRFGEDFARCGHDSVYMVVFEGHPAGRQPFVSKRLKLGLTGLIPAQTGERGHVSITLSGGVSKLVGPFLRPSAQQTGWEEPAAVE